jgi:CO/xanthine dehydrogenase Mo-binding subunit
MGASTALVEEIIFKERRATADNFDGYPLLTMSDAPQSDNALITVSKGSMTQERRLLWRRTG